MVVYGDENNYLGVQQALLLGVEELHKGNDPKCQDQIVELVEQEWIEVAADGGWMLMPTLAQTATPL